MIVYHNNVLVNGLKFLMVKWFVHKTTEPLSGYLFAPPPLIPLWTRDYFVHRTECHHLLDFSWRRDLYHVFTTHKGWTPFWCMTLRRWALAAAGAGLSSPRPLFYDSCKQDSPTEDTSHRVAGHFCSHCLQSLAFWNARLDWLILNMHFSRCRPLA